MTGVEANDVVGDEGTKWRGTYIRGEYDIDFELAAPSGPYYQDRRKAI